MEEIQRMLTTMSSEMKSGLSSVEAKIDATQALVDAASNSILSLMDWKSDIEHQVSLSALGTPPQRPPGAALTPANQPVIMDASALGDNSGSDHPGASPFIPDDSLDVGINIVTSTPTRCSTEVPSRGASELSSPSDSATVPSSTFDFISMLVATAASDGALGRDAISAAAPMHATCSKFDTTDATKPLVLAPVLPLLSFAIDKPDKPTLTKCSTECSGDDTNMVMPLFALVPVSAKYEDFTTHEWFEEMPPHIKFKGEAWSWRLHLKPPWPSFRLVCTGSGVSHHAWERFKQCNPNGPIDTTSPAPETHMAQLVGNFSNCPNCGIAKEQYSTCGMWYLQDELSSVKQSCSDIQEAQQASVFLDTSFGSWSCVDRVPISIFGTCSALKLFPAHVLHTRSFLDDGKRLKCPKGQIQAKAIAVDQVQSGSDILYVTNGHVHHMLLQPKRDEMHQLVAQTGKCMSLFIQPKPPWLFVLTPVYAHVEKRELRPHGEVMTLNSKIIRAAPERYVRQLIGECFLRTLYREDRYSTCVMLLCEVKPQDDTGGILIGHHNRLGFGVLVTWSVYKLLPGGICESRTVQSYRKFTSYNHCQELLYDVVTSTTPGISQGGVYNGFRMERSRGSGHLCQYLASYLLGECFSKNTFGSNISSTNSHSQISKVSIPVATTVIFCLSMVLVDNTNPHGRSPWDPGGCMLAWYSCVKGWNTSKTTALHCSDQLWWLSLWFAYASRIWLLAWAENHLYKHVLDRGVAYTQEFNTDTPGHVVGLYMPEAPILNDLECQDLHRTISLTESCISSDATVILLSFGGQTHPLGLLLQGDTRTNLPSLVICKLKVQNHQDTVHMKKVGLPRFHAFVWHVGKSYHDWQFAHLVIARAQPVLLSVHAYQMASTMFSFAWGNLDCISLIVTAHGISAELLNRRPSKASGYYSLADCCSIVNNLKNHPLPWDPGGKHMTSLDRHIVFRFPWDPGIAAAAWGQAAFQGGRNVMDPSYISAWAWAWPALEHSSWAWALPSVHDRDYKYQAHRNEKTIQLDHEPDVTFFLPRTPLLSA